MELDYTQGFCQAPTKIYRKEANLTMRESATLTYLLSHKEGFKVSYRRISRDLHSDFRTVKNVIQKLKEKGYKELINKVLLNYNTTTPKCSNNTTFNRNSNTSKKLHHFINNKAQSKRKSSLKNFTQNKVLEHVSRGAVKLQQGCCSVSNTIILIKNNNKELIKKNNFFKIVPKDKRNYPCTPSNDVPVFEYDQYIELEYNYINHVITDDPVINNPIKNEPITIKKGIRLSSNLLNQLKVPKLHNEINNIIAKKNLSTQQILAKDLSLTIPEEFFNIGKEINPVIDLANEYELFRKSKIAKNHTNSNWINAWKRWLQYGLTKYKKGASNMTCEHNDQLINITKQDLTENTKEDMLKQYHELYSEFKEWLFNDYRKLEIQFNTLFTERYNLLEQNLLPRSGDVQSKINSLKEQENALKQIMDDKKKIYFDKLDGFNYVRPCNGRDVYELQKEYIAYCNRLHKEEQCIMKS